MKSIAITLLKVYYMSLPSRGRGLKFIVNGEKGKLECVAPLAGAWVEMPPATLFYIPLVSRSPRGGVG